MKILTRKRGTTWEYRFESAKVDGKRKYISKSGFRTQKEALAAGTQALAEYQNGGLTYSPSDISVSDYMQVWIEKYVEVNLRHKTKLGYVGIINNHINPVLGHYKLNALNPAVLQDFANSLKAKGFSRRHVVGILSMLSNALKYAVSPLQFLRHNPMSDVRMPVIAAPARSRTVLSAEDWKRIISRFPFGNKYHIPLVIGYYTGLRISEVFGLTWDDINFEKLEINVSKQTIRMQKGKWNLDEPKTKSSVRTVKFGKELCEILRREKARQAENRLRYGEYYTFYSLIDKELVLDKNGKVKLICVDENGMLVTTDSFKYCSRIIHHELKIEFDFHCLRHTHATVLIENGVSPKSVQKRLGHEKIETTLQTYVHDTEEMAERAAEIFELVRTKN